MTKKRPFSRSLLAAFRGIGYCLAYERNMRIHMVAVLYVFAFSFFFEVSPTGYAVLLLTFALVLGAEMVNTALERQCDRDAQGFSQWVKVIKDVAAGAVLVCALFAVGVGVCLFWQPESLWGIWQYYTARWWRIPLLLVSLGLAGAFVVWGPKPLWDRLFKK